MSIHETAAELYAAHKEVGEAHEEAGDAFKKALAAEQAGEGLATATAETGSAYRAAGEVNVRSLEASAKHFRLHQEVYISAAIEEAQAAGHEIGGPVSIAKKVQLESGISAA